MRHVRLALIILTIVAGCSGSGASSEETATSNRDPPWTRPSGTEVTDSTIPIAGTGMIANPTRDSGTSDDASINRAPLAIWDPSSLDAFAQEGIGPGTLQISSHCVLLMLDNGRAVLPVWPEPTKWNTETHEIEFVSPAGGTREKLRDGDFTSLGGANIPEDFSLWVSTPARDCQAQAVTTFLVSEVQVLNRGTD